MVKKPESKAKAIRRMPSQPTPEKRLDAIYQRVVDLVQASRASAVRSINTAMVLAYWHIGREIVQEELQGKKRADYGEELITKLSARLTEGFGKGFTVTNLKYMRLFFLKFNDDKIGHAVRDELRLASCCGQIRHAVRDEFRLTREPDSSGKRAACI